MRRNGGNHKTTPQRGVATDADVIYDGGMIKNVAVLRFPISTEHIRCRICHFFEFTLEFF
jgi:hypothetical protein